MKSLSQSVLLVLLLTGCNQQKLEPRDYAFFIAGERAIAGAYTLQSVTDGRPGVTQSVNVGKEPLCTLDVLTNHTFAIANLPIPGSSKTVSVTGSWSVAVYRAFDSRDYKVSFSGVTNIFKVYFPDADFTNGGTNPVALSIWWKDMQGPPLDYQFRQGQTTAPSPPPR